MVLDVAGLSTHTGTIGLVYMYAYSKVVGNGMENTKNWGTGWSHSVGTDWIGYPWRSTAYNCTSLYR